MLGVAMIGLDAGKHEVWRCHNEGCQIGGGLSGQGAAAATATVDLDQHVEPDAISRGGLVQDRNDACIVDADGDPRTLRQPCQPVDLGGMGDFVGDQHVGDAAAHQRLGLRNLLAADPDGAAMGHLVEGDIGRLVGLSMGT